SDNSPRIVQTKQKDLKSESDFPRTTNIINSLLPQEVKLENLDRIYGLGDKVPPLLAEEDEKTMRSNLTLSPEVPIKIFDSPRESQLLTTLSEKFKTLEREFVVMQQRIQALETENKILKAQLSDDNKHFKNDLDQKQSKVDSYNSMKKVSEQ